MMHAFLPDATPLNLTANRMFERIARLADMTAQALSERAEDASFPFAGEAGLNPLPIDPREQMTMH
jgi:hypothetical protein